MGCQWVREAPIQPKWSFNSPPHAPYQDGVENSVAYFTAASLPPAAESIPRVAALCSGAVLGAEFSSLLHSHGAAAGWETRFPSDGEQISFHHGKDNTRLPKYGKSLVWFSGVIYALGGWFCWGFFGQLHVQNCVSVFDKMQIVLLALGKVNTGLFMIV